MDTMNTLTSTESTLEIINIANSDSNLMAPPRCTLAAEVALNLPPPFHLSPCYTLALENWVKQNAAECGTGRGDFRGSAKLRFHNGCGTEM